MSLLRTPLPAGRLVAFDLGDVQIGVASSDTRQTVATPTETIHIKRGLSVGQVTERVADCARRLEASGIVIGYPRTLDGREGSAASRCRKIAEAVADTTGLPVRLWDERFTTVEAEHVMLAQGAKRATRKGAIDRVAATLILQSFLDRAS